MLQHLWENWRTFSVNTLKLDYLDSNSGWISSVNSLYLINSAATTVQFRSPVAIAAQKASGLSSSVLTAAEIAVYLLEELVKANQFTRDNQLNFEVEITQEGWIEYHLQDASLALWLDYLSTASVAENICIVEYKTSQNYFSLQYIYARCCAILRLAQGENLIDLRPNWTQAGVKQAWPWLNQNGLWHLNNKLELDLLHKIIRIAHIWDSQQTVNLYKLTANLGASWLDFERYSQMIGKSDQCLARIGLTALTQFWLHRLLQQLGIEAIATL